MTWTSLDSMIVMTAVLSALACALPGVFLVLRRMSMMGDAISHAVLPGLAVAFLVTGSRNSMAMFVGAAVVGVLTALLTQWISRFGKVEESASTGVVFTTLFALGLILIVQAADAVDLDPGCVLYGAIELSPLDTVSVLGFDVPRAALTSGIALLINGCLIGFLLKEFKISAFDPALATTLGIRSSTMHYLLMVMVAMTAVACFESVGSILVIAMLIVPAATAFLLVGRLVPMLIWTCVFAAASAVLGHVAAITVPTWFGFSDTSTAGMISVVAGVIFLSVLVVAPRQGIIPKFIHQMRLSVRVASEDILGRLFRHEETPAVTRVAMSRESLIRGIAAGPMARMLAWHDLSRRGMMIDGTKGTQLTQAGRFAAQDLVRSHRLWESYLHEQAGVRPDHVHGSSEKLEHVTDRRLQDALAEQLRAVEDPHGHPIPPDTGAGRS